MLPGSPKEAYKDFQGRNPYNIFIRKRWHQIDIAKLTDLYLLTQFQFKFSSFIDSDKNYDFDRNLDWTWQL